jgi:hypothetical protein
VERAQQLSELSAFYHECRQADRAGVVLIAEGRM